MSSHDLRRLWLGADRAVAAESPASEVLALYERGALGTPRAARLYAAELRAADPTRLEELGIRGDGGGGGADQRADQETTP